MAEPCILFIIFLPEMTYYWQSLVMTVQNITLHCNEEESRVLDCSYDETLPSECYDYLGVECEAGSIQYLLPHYCVGKVL